MCCRPSIKARRQPRWGIDEQQRFFEVGWRLSLERTGVGPQISKCSKRWKRKRTKNQEQKAMTGERGGGKRKATGGRSTGNDVRWLVGRMNGWLDGWTSVLCCAALRCCCAAVLLCCGGQFCFVFVHCMSGCLYLCMYQYGPPTVRATWIYILSIRTFFCSCICLHTTFTKYCHLKNYISSNMTTRTLLCSSTLLMKQTIVRILNWHFRVHHIGIFRKIQSAC